MYSPTTRMLTVLALLQSRQQISGAEIARRLEVDTRTVRRYITMLQDMGVPVEAERGPHGAYQLGRGAKMPPLMFTDAEAVALTLGLLVIREFRFPVEVAAVEGALAKTERVLPDLVAAQVRGLQEAITFNVSLLLPVLHVGVIETLGAAVQQTQRVFLRYRSWSGEVADRDFDPYGIVFNDGYWYTAGYCHLRQELRTFRLDRVIIAELRDQPFERPAQFDLLSFVLSSIAFGGTQEIEVVLKTSMERARAVILPVMGTLEASEAGIIFRRAATQLNWIAHLLISFDFPVVIRQPAELRTILREMAAKALQIADDET
jgi:predicted DNA-binding transcriptional regulator YafY